MNEVSRNEVELEGNVLSAPVLSHENHGTPFYRFDLEIPRLSGQADRLPILITESLVPLVIPGTSLRILGQLRSFNNRSGRGSRLILSVYARVLQPGSGAAANRILLTGTLCKPPSLRRTPLGRSICDLMVAIPRRYGRADYLPVIAWGRLATAVSERTVGSSVALEGRVQSRGYTKVTDGNSEERTAYEVSVMHLLDEEPPADEA